MKQFCFRRINPVNGCCRLVEAMIIWVSGDDLHEKDNEMLLVCCFSRVPVSEQALLFIFPSFSRDRRNNLSDNVLVTQGMYGSDRFQQEHTGCGRSRCRESDGSCTN